MRFNLDIPKVEPLSFKKGALIFGGLVGLASIGAGAAVGSYVMLGCISLAGLIAIAESNKYIKYAIKKGNKTIDFIIFGASVWASASAGVTIAVITIVTGLGFTLVYIPWVREEKKIFKF